MASEPDGKPFFGFRNPLFYTSILMVVAAVYVGVKLYSRRQENREIAEKNAAVAAQKRANDQATFEMLGGNDFKIMSFYATPSEIRRGESVQLCYGVSNTKTVKLEPQTNPVWPSATRCVDVAPKKTTEYTLTAEDGRGNSLTSKLTVEVR